MQQTVYFFVAADLPRASGGTLVHARLSRPITRLSTSRRVLRRIQRSEPAAFLVQVRHFR